MEKTMTAFTDDLCKRLHAELRDTEASSANTMQHAQRAVHVIQQYLQELKQFIVDNGFADASEEIRFFKEIKPDIYKLFIYHLRIFEIETQKPTGGTEFLKKHFERHLKLVGQHFIRHKDFYQYYRSGATHMDEQYFMRPKDQPTFFVSEYHGLIDKQFYTTYGFIASKIKAGEMIQEYLMTELIKITAPQYILPNPIKTATNLEWSAPKVALVELSYALYAAGAVYPATTDVKKIAETLSVMFNTPLGNIYKMYEEIRLRKKNRTPFLQALIQNLNQKMDFDDEYAR